MTEDSVAADPSSRIQRPAVEYGLTEHCNLACAGCDHASAILPTKFAELGNFERDLKALSRVLKVDKLKLSGGEPLLHPQLLDFVLAGQKSDLAREVWLVTNGKLLHEADDALFDAIDGLRVTRYPGVSITMTEQELEKRSADHGFALLSEATDTFRSTLLHNPHEDPALVRRIYADCGLAHRWSCHVIHEGRYFKCPPAALHRSRLAASGAGDASPGGMPKDNRGQDSVRLHDNPTLRPDLDRYLRSERPLQACNACMGSSGRELPHRQLSEDERQAGWIGMLAKPDDLLTEGAFGIRNKVRRFFRSRRAAAQAREQDAKD